VMHRAELFGHHNVNREKLSVRQRMTDVLNFLADGEFHAFETLFTVEEGKLGVVVSFLFADLLVVDGNPLKDLGLFKDGGPHLSAILKGGRFHKNTLS